MTIALKSLTVTRLAVFTALFTALAVPLRVSGVAIEQGALGLALITALLLVAKEPAVRQRLRHAVMSRQGVAVAAIFMAWVVTALFSHDPLVSLKIGGRTGLFVLASTVIWAVVIEHEETHRLLLKTLIITALVCAGLALLSFAGVPYILSALKGVKLSLEFPSTGFKAFAASAMCLTPIVAWAGRRLDGVWRWWGYAFAPMALAVMFLTYNRSAIAGLIAMAIVGTVLLALAKRRHTKALIATALAAPVGIIAWVANREIQFQDFMDQHTGTTIDAQTYLPTWLLDAHRQNIWKFAYERFLEHPWVGNGIDQLNRLPGANMPVPGLHDSRAFMVPSHPHNWAMEILAETGLVGFLPVVIVLTFFAWKLAKNYMQTDNEADLALFTLMAGFWASALFNFSIWAVWWQLTFFILFAIVAATRAKT